MGVYIPNIEKPKFCKCEEYNCFAWDDEKYKCKITEWKKPCPLIEMGDIEYQAYKQISTTLLKRIEERILRRKESR